MMRDLAPPGRPVVRDVVAPEVDLVADPLLREDAAEALRRLERTGRVLPLPLPANEQQRRGPLQPVEVRAVQVAAVVHRVVEIDRVPALAAAEGGDGVDAAHADR